MPTLLRKDPTLCPKENPAATALAAGFCLGDDLPKTAGKARDAATTPHLPAPLGETLPHYGENLVHPWSTDVGHLQAPGQVISIYPMTKCNLRDWFFESSRSQHRCGLASARRF
jgi:hypothetical protein